MVWGCSLNLVKQIRVETVGDYLHLAEVQLYDLFHAEVSTVDWLYIAEGLFDQHMVRRGRIDGGAGGHTPPYTGEN